MMLLSGIGLGASAIQIYHRRADKRITQTAQLSQLERAAELRQKDAQLRRAADAPIWINNQAYSPDVDYQLSGVTRTEVPVIVGFEKDTAVCIGTMGPEGFIQNPEHPICLGY